ncbi:MAG: hypothetical protein R3D05_08965 [Dongiaceae bacterium]
MPGFASSAKCLTQDFRCWRGTIVASTIYIARREARVNRIAGSQAK